MAVSIEQIGFRIVFAEMRHMIINRLKEALIKSSRSEDGLCQQVNMLGAITLPFMLVYNRGHAV